MGIELLPLFLFVCAMIYAPGPSNITSAGIGMLYGYRNGFRFMVGVATSCLLVMLLCAFISMELLETIPSVEPYLRAAGVCYLLYLAFVTARATYDVEQKDQQPMAFKHGFVMQTLNPNGVIFGLTIYTTFLASLANQPTILTASAIGLSIITFTSVLVWAVAGSSIGRFLHNPKVRMLVNATLVTLLLYCALSLSGVLG